MEHWLRTRAVASHESTRSGELILTLKQRRRSLQIQHCPTEETLCLTVKAFKVDKAVTAPEHTGTLAKGPVAGGGCLPAHMGVERVGSRGAWKRQDFVGEEQQRRQSCR